MSSGVPNRCIGMFHFASASARSASVSMPSAFLKISVGVAPGATPFTRMRGASSADAVIVNELTAAFAAP